ncbi:MAG: response regulator [Cyanobacteria bacterium P01_F01_bin.4]
MLTIAIVNDTVIAVEAIRRVIATVADYQVLWTAQNGAEAVAKCAAMPPDLILMDLIMPQLDGVMATRQIMATCPCAILIVTASVRGNTPKVFEAMGYGALDVVSTPILGRAGHPTAADPLLGKIRTIAKLLGKATRTPPLRKTPQRQNPIALGYPLVVIGASTGGPNALATIFSRLPSSLEAAIIVVQHIDVIFTEVFVNLLDQQ